MKPTSTQFGNCYRRVERTLVLLIWLVLSCATQCVAQVSATRDFYGSERLTLGTHANRSAAVHIADVDSDHDLDVIVANGRHWPQPNFVFLNMGRARFTVQHTLGTEQCTSYSAVPADLDGDGDLDIAVGNDMAPNQIFLNDGDGRFLLKGTFGDISSLRSLTMADMDGDGDIDILANCRGRQNQIYLNQGNAKFSSGIPFGNTRDSTIDVAATDWNSDGHQDLVLANRDNQRNAILLNNGKMEFEEEILFGKPSDQTRAVAVADLNGDSIADVVTGNIGQLNKIYLADGNGGFAETIEFGFAAGHTYALAVADMNKDQHLDLVVGNVGGRNAVFFNAGNGKEFNEVRFGEAVNATYGIDIGDLDGDGYNDIVVANSDAKNYVFLNRPTRIAPRTVAAPDVAVAQASDGVDDQEVVIANGTDWPSFRGKGARGVAEGFALPAEWNAGPLGGENSGVLWATDVPGLGHSSPVVFGDRIFLTTAVADAGKAPLMVQRGGRPDAADDNGEQTWLVLCYDRRTGAELWRKAAHRGRPQATRHAKATHANTSVVVDGDNVLAFFGSEGIYCYDLEGNLKWSRDLGVINISKYGIGWGFASSPAIHDEQFVIVCDDPDNPFVAALRLADGEEIWRRSREGICERSWGTPFIHASDNRTQVVVNGWPWIVSYDLGSGQEVWRIRGGGDNPVPTPFEANGWFYITSAHGAQAPIFVVRPDASGDISPPEDTGTNDSVVWSTRRGGAYMSTPVVYGDHLYLGNTNGVVRCFHAKTGESIYEKRLGEGAAITASLVAGDGKIYCSSENGKVYVLAAGPEFRILASNDIGHPCFATPAISEGVLFIRTTSRLVAIE